MMEQATLALPGPVTDLTFTVLGAAQPAGSKRAFPNSKTGRMIVTDDNPRAKPWQATVAAAGHEAMAGRSLLDEPLMVRFAFFVVRPKGHYRTGRNAHLLRDSAPVRPITRPDVLKLSRAVEDALTGICWRDDSLIVSEQLEKYFGEPARCDVEIHPLIGMSA